MLFDLNPSPTFVATVNITVAGEPSRPLQVRYRRKDTEEYRAFVHKQQGDREMVSEIVESVIDKDPASTDAQFLERLLAKFPTAAMDIYITFCREMGESRAKN